MRVGIIAKAHRTEFAGKLQEVLQWLHTRGCEIVVEDVVVGNFKLAGLDGIPRDEIPGRTDMMIVFGGDGTILSMARLVRESQTPILAVNLGSLGFLTEVTLNELYPALERFLEGKHRIDRRELIRTELRRTTGDGNVYHALNDAVINKGALARIISMDAYINDDFVANFLADGMIISTPTGSTAYSLSAGGPVVHPALNAFIITPICPHTLTNRPLVVPSDRKIRIVLKQGDDVMLTVDGQIGLALQQGDEVICTRSDYQIDLIQSGQKSFFDVLRTKLKWAERY